MFLSELSDGMEDFEDESKMCRKGCPPGYKLVPFCKCVRRYDDDETTDDETTEVSSAVLCLCIFWHHMMYAHVMS